MDETDTSMSPESFPPDVQRVVRRLDALGLRDRDGVWARFEQHGWISEKVVEDLNRNLSAEEARFTRAELGNAVAELVRLDVDQLAAPRWPIAALRIAFLALMIALIVPLTRPPAPPQPVAARDIPPYHILVDDDITVLPATANDSIVAAQRKALRGRYTTRPIPSGSPIGADAHADGARVPGLSERRVATLRVIPPDTSLSAALPARVTLTAAASGVPAECADAWLLRIVREATAATALATVALPQACTTEPLGALVGARAIALVWDPRPGD